MTDADIRSAPPGNDAAVGDPPGTAAEAPPHGAVPAGLLIEHEVGRSAFFATFKAQRRDGGGPVALKLPRADVDRELARNLLCREVAVLQRLDHPGLAQLLDFDDTPGADYLVTAWAEGQSLADLLAGTKRRYDQHSLQPLLLGLLDALAVMHEQSILHLDIKPGNLLILPSGAPRLIDFGSARDLRGGPDETESFSDLTPGYAAPERYGPADGEGPWSDLYSLAAVAYRALSGVVPPDARDRLAEDELIPLRELAPAGASPAFLAAIDCALALDPAARSQQAKDWQAMLAAAPVPDPGEQVTVTASTGHAEDDPDYPPTLRVARLPEVALKPKPKAVPLSLPSDAPPVGPGGRGARRKVVVLAAVICCLSVAAAAYPAWEGYRRYVKSDWTVDASGGGDTSSIAAALEAARAGSVVRVLPGTYNESLVMNRPVTLLGVAGEDGALPVIVPAAGPCLRADAPGAAVRQLHFRAAPVTPDEAVGESQTATPPPCIQVTAGGVVIEGNEVSGLPGIALWVGKGADAELRGNSIAQVAGAGIVLEAGTTSVVEDNSIRETGKAGLVVRGGAAPVIVGNRIEGSGQAGLLIEDGASGRYQNNDILASQGGGIEVRDGSNPIVAENRIEQGAESGIFLYRGARGEFSGNLVSGNAYSGVIIASGASPQLSGNEIVGNRQHGVLVLDTGAGVLRDNTIKDNAGHGVAQSNAADMEVADNQLTGNRAPQLRIGDVELR